MAQVDRISAPAPPRPRSEAGCTVLIVDPAAVDAAMLANWADLSRGAEEPNPFFAPWFLMPAIRWLDADKAVRLLVLRDDATGALVGLMPVVAGATYGGLPVRNLSTWKNNHLYVGTPLIHRGHAPGAMRALVGWIGTCPTGLCFLRLTQFPGQGQLHRALVAACAELGRPIAIGDRRTRAVLRHGHEFEGLLEASSSTKQRAELRRRFRRFDEGDGATLDETVLTPAAAPALAEAFMRLENDGWKRASEDGFALAKTDAESAFFREAVRRGAEGEHVLAAVLSRDDAPVAIGLTLREGDRAFGFKTAFDRAQGRFSPGVRIFHETTRRMLAGRDCSLYDSCARPDHPVIDALWPDRLDSVQVDIAASGAANAHLLRLAARMVSVREGVSRAWAGPERPGMKRK